MKKFTKLLMLLIILMFFSRTTTSLPITTPTLGVSFREEYDHKWDFKRAPGFNQNSMLSNLTSSPSISVLSKKSIFPKLDDNEIFLTIFVSVTMFIPFLVVIYLAFLAAWEGYESVCRGVDSEAMLHNYSNLFIITKKVLCWNLLLVVLLFVISFP